MLIGQTPIGHDSFKTLGLKSAATTNITFTNLDGDNEKVYRVKGWYKIITCTGSPNLYIELNGDSGSGQYLSHILAALPSSVTSANSSSTTSASCATGITAAHITKFFLDATIYSVPRMGGINEYSVIIARVDAIDKTSGELFTFIVHATYKDTTEINAIKVGVSGSVTESEGSMELSTPGAPPVGRLKLNGV